MGDLSYTVMLIGVFVVLALGWRWLNRWLARDARTDPHDLPRM